MRHSREKELCCDTLKILLIEDDDDHAALATTHLKNSSLKNAPVSRVTRLGLGLEKIAQEKWDVILLDLSLPDSAGNHTLERVLAAAAHTPVVVLSSLEDCNVAVRTVHDGAQDYLFKSELTGYILERTIKQAMYRSQLIKDLAKSNQDLEQFAYIASHDLRAPLRAISNLATWIEEDSYQQLSEDSRDNFKLLKNRIERMNSLLNALLQYSRIGRKKYEIDVIDTGSLFREVVAQTGTEDRINLNLGPNLPTIRTERVPLELVVRNLITNSVKHSGKKVVTIGITCESDGKLYKFCVKDDGAGISSEYHSRVFELFQTLKPRDEVEGSGMGLAIVKKTVEMMGGEVSLQSKEGEGAAFTFTWPVAPPSP